MKRYVLTLAALLYTPFAGAHHSYGGYDPAERYVFSGTITEIEWGNPHILFAVYDGKETMRIEWMTLQGAQNTGVTKEQFSVGERITITGSRNRNPELKIITLVRQVDLPGDDWSWKRP